MPFAATWMELESLILSEVSQKDKDKYHVVSYMIFQTYMQRLKYGTEESIYRTETDSHT